MNTLTELDSYFKLLAKMRETNDKKEARRIKRTLDKYFN